MGTNPYKSVDKTDALNAAAAENGVVCEAEEDVAIVVDRGGNACRPVPVRDFQRPARIGASPFGRHHARAGLRTPDLGAFTTHTHTYSLSLSLSLSLSFSHSRYNIPIN